MVEVGKTCRKCGEWRALDGFHAKRDNSDGRDNKCKSCVLASRKAYRAANPERVAAANRAYREANSDRLRAYSKRYRELNRERLDAAARERYWSDPTYRRRQRALVAAWVADHPDYMAQHYRAKRAKRAGVRSEPFDPAAIWDGICALCGGELDASVSYPDPMSKSLDHIIPLARGGTHTLNNVQWAHLVCNLRKGVSLDAPDERFNQSA